MSQKKSFLKIMGVVISLLILAVVFYLRASQNLESTIANQYGTNFFTFWGAGNMVTRGENPYDVTQYLANHDRYEITWRPNQLFPYPLPLALLLAPLGLLPLPIAFLVLQFITQIIIALAVYLLLKRWDSPAHQRLFLPVTLFMLFFGPVLLGMKTGSINALPLLFVLGTILLLEKNRPFPAGMILSLTLLKPPQGVTILLLAGIWLLARRDWKAIVGIACGGIALLIVGLLQDPLWISKFQGATQAVLDRTQGVHANVWTVTYYVCAGMSPCSSLLGAFGSLALLSLGGYFLWKNQMRLSAWEAFNFILPIGFVATVYLWTYDQTPFIIPIVWIVGSLVQLTKKYIDAFLFLILLDIFSIFAATQLSATQKDLWGFGTSFLILGVTMALWIMQKKRNADTERETI